MYKSRVGSKGELFPPKKLRKKLGLEPRRRVVYRIEKGRLIVEPIPSLEEVLSEPPAVKVSIEEFHDFRRELSRRAEA